MNYLYDVVANYSVNAWCEWLDDFYRASNGMRAEMVEKYPFDNAYLSLRQCAFIAASVNYLCNKYDIKNPDWVYKPEFILRKPFFAMDAKGDLRIYLLQMSPKEYRTRNIFVDDPLRRC